MSRCWPLLLVTALFIGTTHVSGQDTPPAPTERFADVPSLSPVTDSMLYSPDPGDWLSWRRTLDAWAYSPLDQIDRDNVADLTLVWSRPLSEGSPQEGTPLVHEGVMFMPNPRDVIQAIDAVTGDLYWQYRRPLPDDLGEYFIIFVDTNRNLAIYGDLIIDTSLDDYAFALDAHTGAVAWETRILDYRAGALQTSGPIVADGKVISGRGCEPAGGPDACVITAHDALTGVELWRRRTIPAPGEPGDETWGGVPFEERRHVGTWMVPSYDPELNLVYVGTSVTSPAPKYLLAGNDKTYLYHNSTLALDAATGEIVWYYQHVVDHWDMDHPFERILLDTVVAPDPSEVTWISPSLEPGERRRVVTGIPGKTGVVYTLDRETGEFLWARPTVSQNVIADIDGVSGQVTVNPETRFTDVNQTRLVCPGSGGGKNWPAGAYSPRTGLMYFPQQQACQRVTSTLEEPSPDRSLYGIQTERADPPGGRRGTVRAISVATGKTAWELEQEARTFSLVATAGGLVFGGDDNGRFRALDDQTGEVLWEVNLGSPVLGFPISYGVDGRQYVATSVGGAANTLFVFALPD